MGEEDAKGIRSLVRELKKNKVRIYTSIITVQEISVLAFRRGTMADDPLSKVQKMVRFSGVTKEIALTAAKLEAQIKDDLKLPKEEQQNENRRRKWDCFHIATAMYLGCTTLYTSDKKFLGRQSQLGIDSMRFSKPIPNVGTLDLGEGADKEKGATREAVPQATASAAIPLPVEVQRGGPGP